MRLPGDKLELDLFHRGLFAVVTTLVVSLLVLLVVLLIITRIVNEGHPLFPPEIRHLVWKVVFVSVGTVFFFALGGAAFWIGRLVVRYERAHERALAEKELHLAAEIQASAMPRTFPPFPELKCFDIYASMKAAKDVGGDFYDFYFSRPNRLVFLVADVSGKGVPAALFMMRAKSLLKGFVQTGLSLAESVARTNEGLCEGNDSSVFVTAWIGELNTETGVVHYVNAGHNRPILRKAGGKGADYIRDTPGLFLGAISGVPYVVRKLCLNPGDSLYLYTDGITEQVNPKLELFGEDRLLHAVSTTALRQQALLDRVSRAVSHHSCGAEQTDDCTQLEIVWRGKTTRTIRDYAPVPTAIAQSSADLERALDGVAFGPKTELLTAADEIVTNIVGYSGATKWSLAVERCRFPEEVRLVFTDDGTPFDPLKAPPPDTSLAIEDRPVGGLGIFIVKSTMESVTYAYRDGRNVLTVCKSLEVPSGSASESGEVRVPLAARLIRRKKQDDKAQERHSV